MNEANAYQQNQAQNLDDMVTEYLPLVKRIALFWSARLPPTIELDDLIQVGLLGLIKASESYDASQGASFATYASIRVKGAMLDEVRRNDWVPRSLQQKMKQVTKAIHTAESRTGTVAKGRDIARELGLSLEEYQKVATELTWIRMTSLDEREQGEPDASSTPVAVIEQAGFQQALTQAIGSLPEKEQLMMSLYYVEELNLKEIGVIMGVSESRVSQIHGQSLARLRVRLTDWVA
tara:strand:- start:31730 stop:32434 length:705 start_codon:yes stop_codon:yes gene_type:complete